MAAPMTTPVGAQPPLSPEARRAPLERLLRDKQERPELTIPRKPQQRREESA
jgi:hypothetical protein